MSDFNVLQVMPEDYVVHLNKRWSPNTLKGYTDVSLEIKNTPYRREIIITDDTPDYDIEIPNPKFYFGALKTNNHVSSVTIDVRALYNCYCLSFDFSDTNVYWVERETRIILSGLNRPVDMRIEMVRDSDWKFCSEYMIQLQNLIFGLYNIFNDKQTDKLLYNAKSVYTTDVVRFFADLYLRFHETDFRTFNMDNSLLFKQAIYEYSPEELEQIISMCLNTELMEEYITSERTSGECKTIVIKRMAELGVDNNRFDL